MKTLTMTLAALALVAVAVAPSGSALACRYIGPAPQTVNYALPCSTFGAGDDAQSVVEFVLEEAGEAVAFAVDLVTGIPLP
jgi:ABC-type amino acid transport substrate-binding protein